MMIPNNHGFSVEETQRKAPGEVSKNFMENLQRIHKFFSTVKRGNSDHFDEFFYFAFL
jgi:hypothetical protein